MLILNHAIGSDVEFFLQDKETKEIVSAEGIIKGTKHEPFRFDPKNPFYATSLDNVLAEGNIPPAKTPAEFYKNVETLINFINSSIPGTLQTVSLPAARLDQKYLETDNAQIFGCDPSLNCWTEEIVQPQPSGDNLRSTGFHIHVGYDQPSVERNILLGKAMDLFLGIPSIILEPKNERKLVGYGCAGNIRHQRHGMEYRSLSGFFASSQSLIEWCFNNANEAVNFVNNYRIEEIEDLADTIQNTINNEDIATARNLIDKFNIKIAA